MNIIIRNPQKAECFSSLFQHVRQFTDHINIMFEKDKMYLQSMDSSKVSVFEISLPSTWFDVYEHNSASAIPIGVNSTMLFKILNTRDKAQEMQFVYNSVDNDDKLYVSFTSTNKSIFDKKFEMPLVDIEMDLVNIPATESQAEFSISSLNFANIINQMKLFGDTLEIHCTEENISLHADSPECGKMLVEINIDDLTSYAINEGETIHLSFSLALLHNICLYNKLVKDMEIHLTENYPMKIIFSLDNEMTDAKMTFYLAPKINDE